MAGVVGKLGISRDSWVSRSQPGLIFPGNFPGKFLGFWPRVWDGRVVTGLGFALEGQNPERHAIYDRMTGIFAASAFGAVQRQKCGAFVCDLSQFFCDFRNFGKKPSVFASTGFTNSGEGCKNRFAIF